MDSPALGFVAHTNGATMPGAEVGSAGAFSIVGGKLQPHTLDGREPSTREAKASDAHFSNGPSAGGGLCAMSGPEWGKTYYSIVRASDAITAIIYGIIRFEAAGNDGVCRLTATTIGQPIERDERTVRRSIKELERLGLISVRARRGLSPEIRMDGDPAGELQPRTRVSGPTPDKNVRTVKQPRTKMAVGSGQKWPVIQEGPEVKTPPSGGGDVPSPGSAPGELADRLEGITGLSFEPDPAATALVDSLASESKPKAKRVDVWQPLKEAWRLSLKLPATTATWKFSQKSVAVAKENGVAPADGPAVWARFEAWARAAGEWKYVTRQTADERFAKYLGDHHVKALASNGRDPRFWFKGPTGAWSLRNPQAVAASMGDGFNPHDPTTWPADMRAVYASRIYATDDGREAFA